jgi:hypothetical protein
LSLFRHDSLAINPKLHSKFAPPMALVAAARGFAPLASNIVIVAKI